MPSATSVRNQIEAVLSNRIPSALSPVPRTSRLVTPVGIRPLDALLEGGFPVGAITELVGAPCSGRTTVALGYLSLLTQTGNVCAWIDAADALDPETVAANGVDVERLLWVRCGRAVKVVAPSTPLTPGTSSALFSGKVAAGGGGSPHPRSEGRNMPEAISSMLRAHGGLYDKIRQEKRSGAPLGAQRPVPAQREEQVNSDRLPPRRGDNLTLPSHSTYIPRGAVPAVRPAVSSSPTWQALDQALRSADLLLQSGGFSAIVMDLGSIPPEIAWRIPLATWFRFRAACERTRASLVLLTQHPCARSSAELVVRLEPGSMEAQSKVMTGIRYHAVTERSRAQEREPRVVPIRKPPQSERPGQWTSEVPWAHEK